MTLSACALVLLPLSILAVRNVGLFLMVAVPAITALTEVDREPSRARRERASLNLAVVSAAATASIAAIVYAYVMRIDHLRWTPLPVGSLRALSTCSGNLYNRYDEGGYLIWFAPQKRVFLDGRQDPYEPQLVLEQIRIETTGDYSAAFAQYNIGCASLPTSSPVAARLTTAGWRSLYNDPNWVVLAR